MKPERYRRSVFCVTYILKGKDIKYLILKRRLHWKGWEFPKGGVGFLEGEKGTARREIKEETGLKILNMKRFNVHGRYKYKKKFLDRIGFAGQSYVLYAIKVARGKVRIDNREHEAYKWLTFKEAMKIITHGNQKRCLKIADGWLKNEIQRI